MLWRAATVEYVDVDINGVRVGRIFEKAASDCPDDPDMGQLIVPAQTYNDAVGGSDVVINLVANGSSAPTILTCSDKPCFGA